ncbi:MAG TPA: aminoacyl-histidine dipeptidase [Candidatus Anaerobutyricum avicola]|nr:aminoacyl-histidine dipeptidase [Candidatus Anaerobutyricum avicola]
MGVLSALEPAKVFQFFEEICSIPHGSGNVEQISNYLVDFAKERGLKYRQDEKYNVVIWKDGSKGYEDSEPVILQGHMDMVAVKTADCPKDMEKDGLDLEVNGDLISAKGTSLGGDDGIAVAYSLAILDDPDMPHPPLEVIITTDEEIGMLGAAYMDVSDIKGHLFLNMDSEDEGIFTVSCAGGATVTCKFPYERENVQAAVMRVSLDGFSGGHSGVEIDKGRANANVVMGRLLYSVMNDVRLISINGGEKDNAIALSCQVEIAVPADKAEEVKNKMQETFAIVAEEYKVTDPNAALHVEAGDADKADGTAQSTDVQALTAKDTAVVIQALLHMPYGIQRMNPEIEGLVQTSLNLGILRTNETSVDLSYAVRSASEHEKQFLIDKMDALAVLLGGITEISGPYPGWEYRADSRLRDVLVDTYRELYGNDPVVEGIHAGLECGLFASKMGDIDAVSLGPQMEGIHTVNEVLSISSVQRTWELVTKALAALK